MGKERYWRADLPEILLDWVSENVEAAVKQQLEELAPIAWVDGPNDSDCEKMAVTFAFGEKIVEGADGAVEDVYSQSFPIIEMLEKWADPYANSSYGDHRSKGQLEDLRSRAAHLKALADEISALADRTLARGL